MTIREILKEKLSSAEFTSLRDDNGCACDLDDLAPCGCLNLDLCEPCYKIKCNKESCDSSEFCEAESGFCYTTEKPGE